MAVQSFIVIDTNVLAERTRLLRTGLGPTLVYFAKIRDVKILLPEVVEVELRRYVADSTNELSDAIGEATRELREWLGESSVMQRPSSAQIAESIDRRLEDLAPWIRRCASSPELILKAAQRVFDKRAPSHRDGEDAFKDCLIWECIMALPAGSNVGFVSDDVRAFYEPDQKNPERLHPSLAEEATAAGLAVSAHRSLDTLIGTLQGGEPDMDEARAEVALNAALAEPFINAMQLWGLDAIGDGVFTFSPFVTEQPGILYLEFTVECNVSGTATLGEKTYEGASVRISGNCIYDPHGPVRNMRVTRISLRATDGSELAATAHAYVSASSRRRQRFEIRRSLKDKGSSPKGDGKPKPNRKRGNQEND